MGMGMGVSFQYPMGMGVIFENGYGCGYSLTRPESAPLPFLMELGDTCTHTQRQITSNELGYPKISLSTKRVIKDQPCRETTPAVHTVSLYPSVQNWKQWLHFRPH